MNIRAASLFVAFAFVAVPAHAQGPGQPPPNYQQLANAVTVLQGQVATLQGQVATLEGQITAADLVGTYVVIAERPEGERPPVRVAGVYTPEAVRLLASVMRNTKAPLMARVMAADKLLDRACGRPAQAHSGPSGSGPGDPDANRRTSSGRRAADRVIRNRTEYDWHWEAASESKLVHVSLERDGWPRVRDR
jgi:hypothetical protein